MSDSQTIYLIIKTVSTKEDKPTYECDEIFPQGLPSSTMCSNAYSYHTASNISYATSNLEENFTVKLRWMRDLFPIVSIPAYANSKAEASRKLDCEFDEFQAKEGRNTRTYWTFDRDGDTKEVRIPIKPLGEGEMVNVWFERFEVEVAPWKVWG